MMTFEEVGQPPLGRETKPTTGRKRVDSSTGKSWDVDRVPRVFHRLPTTRSSERKPTNGRSLKHGAVSREEAWQNQFTAMLLTLSQGRHAVCDVKTNIVLYILGILGSTLSVG